MARERTLLVVSSDPDGPVVRHRYKAYEAALAAAGIQLQLGPWPKRARVRKATLTRAESADAVIVSSRLLNLRDVR
ncbi:MAG: hypothetical protein QNJ98_00480, partial [Planctomycetota bacterium]|nr:hypothetical protein [Planctomycetota bacterium]